MSEAKPEGTAHPLDRRRGVREALPPFASPVSMVGAQLVNVSAYGMLVETLVPIEIDAVLPLRLVIAGSKLDVRARVVRRQALIGAKRRFRIGLEFVDLPAEVHEELAYLAKARREG